MVDCCHNINESIKYLVLGYGVKARRFLELKLVIIIYVHFKIIKLISCLDSKIIKCRCTIYIHKSNHEWGINFK